MPFEGEDEVDVKMMPWPVGRSAEAVWAADESSSLIARVGRSGVESITAQATFHGEYDMPCLVIVRNGKEEWLNVRLCVAMIEWGEVPS